MKNGAWLVWLVIALTAILLADQSRYLFTYPVPDTGMWFGDETWTMLTARALVRTGVACVPEALGSSLAHSNGLINGSIWISGILYGLPASVLAAHASPVAIGRSITLLLSLITLLIVYALSRRVGASPFAAALGIFALVLSNAFYFSSHSARLDVITGLGVLVYFYFLVVAFQKYTANGNTLSIRWYFAIAFFAILSITVYVHVPTLIALPTVYALWKLGGFKRWKICVAIFVAAISAAAPIVLIYWSSAGSLNLLGSGYNQYYNVALSLPALHLFSWRVQKINTIDRAIQLWQVAWPLVALIIIGLVSWLISKWNATELQRFYFVLSVLLVISWSLFEGPAVFYNIHVLLILGTVAALLLTPLLQSNLRQEIRYSLALVFIVIFIWGIVQQERFGNVGNSLASNNDAAIHTLIDPIASSQFHPLILTDQPALNDISADMNVRLMTNHLLLFGDENKPLPEILKEHRVNYLLLYSTVRWQSPFRQIADSLYIFIGERTGTLTDQARSYEEPNWKDIDTLRLYKAP
jgi:hypothetical protein